MTKNPYFCQMISTTIEKNILEDKSFKQFLWMIVFILVATMPILFLPKEVPSIWMDQFHGPLLDRFFYYITYLGDGLFFIPILIFLLFRSYSLSAFFVFFVALEAVLVQLVLKKGFFDFLERPSAYIEDFDELSQVAGVHLHSLHSFPSGHTQSIFLVITFLALLNKRGWPVNMGLIIIAALTAISRVYIYQHFFIDIWFGAFIGVLVPVLGVYLWQRKKAIPNWGRFRFAGKSS